MVTLPDSDDFDCVTCTCIADVDWDGSNEIILGTYGQVLFKCGVHIVSRPLCRQLTYPVTFLRKFWFVFFLGTSSLQVHFLGQQRGLD